MSEESKDSSVKIFLVSQEEERFEVPRDVALMSQLVTTMLECMEDGENSIDIPLSNIRSSILVKIIEFLTYHVNLPMEDVEKPIKSINMIENVKDPWDASFVDLTQDVLFELIAGANYIDNKALLDLTCAKAATMIKDKDVSEVRKFFNMPEPEPSDDEEETVMATEEAIEVETTGATGEVSTSGAIEVEEDEYEDDEIEIE